MKNSGFHIRDFIFLLIQRVSELDARGMFQRLRGDRAKFIPEADVEMGLHSQESRRRKVKAKRRLSFVAVRCFVPVMSTCHFCLHFHPEWTAGHDGQEMPAVTVNSLVGLLIEPGFC